MGSIGSRSVAYGALSVSDTAGTIVRTAGSSRGWSQGELGRHCGYSASTISRLESGKTPLRDVVLHQSHRAPKVIPIAAEQEDSVQRRELLSGLVGVTVFPAHATRKVDRTGVVGTAEMLRDRMRKIRADLNACRYSAVASAVPEAIAAGHQLSAATSPGLRRDQLSATLSDGYSLASRVSQKLGDHGLSWLMADRARAFAEATGDPTCLAISTREMAVAMRNTGYFDDASRMLTATADSMSTADASDLAARGCLLLTAAYTQAKNGNDSAAMDLIADARHVARHLPEHGSIFASTQVSVYAIGVHNALGNFSRALTAARSVSLDSLPSVERRVKACLDIARAYQGHGDTLNSLKMLQRLEHLAPEDARRPSVRLVVSQLLERPGPHPAGLTAFARRNGAFV